VKTRLKQIQYRPELIDGFLAQTGLALQADGPSDCCLSRVTMSTASPLTMVASGQPWVSDRTLAGTHGHRRDRALTGPTACNDP
jgi:hypothetical protein